MMTKYIYDLDGTLVNIDTTLDFVRYCIKKTGRSIVKYYLYLFFNIITRGSFRTKIIGLLNGVTRNSIKKWANAYVDELFSKNIFDRDVLSNLQTNIKIGRFCIIASGSLTEVVSAISKRLRVEHFIGSKLTYLKSRFEGSLSLDVVGSKYKLLKRIYPGSRFVVYTDNIDDYDLVNHSLSAYVKIKYHKELNIWKTRANKTKIKYMIGQNATKSQINRFNYVYTYIPTFYYLVSRFQEGVLYSVFVKEIFPIMIVYIFEYGLNNSIYTFFLPIVAYILMISVYEMGILQNDSYSIKFEEKPNARIAPNVNYQWYVFISTRIFLIFLLLSMYFEYSTIVRYVYSSIFMLIVFVSHNFLDKKYRGITFILLRFLKSYIFIALLFNERIFEGVLILFLFGHLRDILKYLYGKFEPPLIVDVSLIMLTFLILIYRSETMQFGIYVCIVFALIFYNSLRKLLKSYISI